MSRFLKKNAAGFSLLELMVVVAIIGILASMAIPRYNIFRARARQGEAKTSLGVIFTLQEAFKIEKEKYYNGSTAWGGAGMDGPGANHATGYLGGDVHTCTSNRLGFRLANCDASRYQYWIDKSATDNGVETTFTAIAYAAGDTPDARIFPGCTPADSGKKPEDAVDGVQCAQGDDAAGKGDAFCIDQNRTLFNFQDIVNDSACTN